jgi:hypothetical protein
VALLGLVFVRETRRRPGRDIPAKDRVKWDGGTG